MKVSDFLLDVGRPVAYYPALAKLIGIKECIFVCQLLWWHGRQADADGWIFKTQAELTDETGLSRWEQESTRSKLRELGVLEEREERLLHKHYYRINQDALNELWEKGVERTSVRKRSPNESGGGSVASGSLKEPHPNTIDSTQITSESTTIEDSLFNSGTNPIESPNSPAPIPKTLAASPEFLVAWSEWLQHLKEKRKSPGASTRRIHLKMCEAMGPAKAIAAINFSICGSYQSIYQAREPWAGYGHKPVVKGISGTPVNGF